MSISMGLKNGSTAFPKMLTAEPTYPLKVPESRLLLGKL